MPRDIFTLYQPRSHRYLAEINIDTKKLHQVPTKNNISIRSKKNKRKMTGVIFATVVVIGVSLGMTLPFIINLDKNESSTTITTSTSNLTTSSSVAIVTNTVTLTTSTTSLTSTTTTSITSTTSTTTDTSSTTTDTTVTTTSTTDSTTTTSDTTTSTTTVTTTTTTQNPYACSNMTILDGYDLGGNDITFQYTANYTLCCAYCLSTANCTAYTWIKSSSSSPCYLKYGVPPHTANSGLVSAHF